MANEFYIPRTREDLRAAADDIKASGIIDFDIETNMLSRFDPRSKILTVAISSENGVYGIKIHARKDDIGIEYSVDDAIEFFREVMEDEGTVKTGHNVKFDLQWTNVTTPIKPVKVVIDTIIMAHLINENRPMNLDFLANHYCQMPLHKSMIDNTNLENEPLSRVLKYNMIDVKKTKALRVHLLEKILESPNLKKVYFKEKAPMLYSLGDMENEGMILDVNTANELKRTYADRLHKLSENYKMMLVKVTGDKSIYHMKLTENDKLKEILLNLGFTLTALTDGGAKRAKLCEDNGAAFIPKVKELKLDAAVLENLSHMSHLYEDPEHYLDMVREFIAPILKFRSEYKLYTTYIKGLLENVCADGKIHCSMNIIGTVTGRLSSSDPNMQNIPRDSDIKAMFIPRPGWAFVEADYSQGEIRVLAIKSGDPVLLDIYKNDEDVYIKTAAFMFSMPVEKVEKWLRQIAKSIVLGLNYGMSEYTLYEKLMEIDDIYNRVKSGELKLTVAICRDYIKRFFEVYQGVKRYQEWVKADAKKRGYTETCVGQIRHLAELYHKYGENSTDRQALNSPIQGTLGALMNFNVTRVNNWLKKNNMRARLVMTVHDSLLAMVPPDEMIVYMEGVKKILEHVPEWFMDTAGVPIKIDYKVGLNWRDMSECKIKDGKIVFKK